MAMDNELEAITTVRHTQSQTTHTQYGLVIVALLSVFHDSSPCSSDINCIISNLAYIKLL